MKEAESRKKEVSQGTRKKSQRTTNKVKTFPNDADAWSMEATPANSFKEDYGLAARTALQKVQYELATKKVEQWVRSELENTGLREKLNSKEKTVKEEDNQEPKCRGLKLKVISGKTFVMTGEGSKILSIILIAGHQVVKNLSEPSEITRVYLDIYADYSREKYTKLDSMAVRALLTTGGPRLTRVDGHYVDVYGPYPILINVDATDEEQEEYVRV